MKLKLFIGAKYRDIDHKYIRESRNPLEEKISQYIQDKHYNIGLHNFGYVMVLMPKKSRETNDKEVIRYFKKPNLSIFIYILTMTCLKTVIF